MLRYNFSCLDVTFHAMPHENLDPWLCHGRRPVRSAGLTRCLWSQRCRAQDRVWTKKWFKNIYNILKSNESYFFDRRLEFSWLASLSTHPSCQHQCGTWRDVDFLAEQIKNAFQRTTIVCSIYSQQNQHILHVITEPAGFSYLLSVKSFLSIVKFDI